MGARTEAKKAEHNDEKQVKAKGRSSEGPQEEAQRSARRNGQDNAKVRFESILPREEAVSYFEAVVAGMKKGTIQLKQGDEAITLKPPAQVGIEVKASRKGEKEKISFELQWHSPRLPSDLKISSS